MNIQSFSPTLNLQHTCKHLDKFRFPGQNKPVFNIQNEIDNNGPNSVVYGSAPNQLAYGDAYNVSPYNNGAMYFTEENGATRVVPGSVGWPDDRRPTDEETVQAAMTAGSVLLYSGSVIHGGGQNFSDTDRTGVNITYCLGWLRTEENQYLSCPPEVAKKLDPDLQEMLGYTMGSYALGYYSDPNGVSEINDLRPPEFILDRSPREKASSAALITDQ